MPKPPGKQAGRLQALLQSTEMRRLVHGVFTSGAAMAVASGLNYLVVIVLAHVATKEEVGTFSYIISMATVLATLADFGMTNVLTRSYHRAAPEERSRLLAITLVTRGALSTLIGALCISLGSAEFRWVGVLLFLWPGDSLILFLNARLAFNQAALLRLTAALLYAGGAIGLWLLFEDPGLAAVARGVSLALVGLFIARRSLSRRAFQGWRWQDVRRLLGSGLVFFGLAVASVVLSHVDVLLLKWMRSAEDVGLYRPVFSLAILPTMIAMVTRIPLNAVVSSGRWADRRQLLRTVHTVSAALMAVSLLIFGLALVWGEDVLVLALGEGYREGTPIFLIILATSTFQSAMAPYHSFIMMLGRPSVLLFLSVFSTSALVGLNIGLIPEMGALGSAWARCGASALGMALVIGHFYRGFLRGLYGPQGPGEDETKGESDA